MSSGNALLNGEQLIIQRQLKQEVANLLLRLAEICQELEERCQDRKKWPELDGDANGQTPPPNDRGTTNEMYQRQGDTYIKFFRAYNDAQSCFSIARALSPELVELGTEFATQTWGRAQAGVPPRLVMEQCTKTRLYLLQLERLLAGNGDGEAQDVVTIEIPVADQSQHENRRDVSMGTQDPIESSPAPGGLSDLQNIDADGTRADRLSHFMRVHPGTTYAGIKYSAGVHTADFQDWRRDRLKSESVMSQRIEKVLSGETPLRKKPAKRQTT
jgi:hypothetical protein